MLSILDIFFRPTTLLAAVLAVPLVAVLYHLVVFVVDHNGLHSIPGPLLAKLTDAWYGSLVFKGVACDVVHAMHKRYGMSSPFSEYESRSDLDFTTGMFVRIAPNHVSIASPEAIPLIYGHSSGLMKGPFYDAFHSFGRPGIFSTRSRADHSRKRRIIAHAFAPKSVRAFEERIKVHIGTLFQKWDEMCSKVIHDQTGKIGTVEYYTRDGMAWFNCMTCE